MQRYKDMRDAYSLVYENRMAARMEKMPEGPGLDRKKKTHSISDLKPSKEPSPEEKAKARKALGLSEAIDILAESGIIDEEELELLEMRRMDKEAGKESGGSQDPALRYVKKMRRDMYGGKEPGQMKKNRGEKRARSPQDGPTPKQKVERRRAERKRAEDAMHSRFD